MKFRLFTFIKEGFKGFFRNGLMSFASILILFSSLFMIGIFTTLVKNVNYNLDAIEDFNDLVCYMNVDATEEEITAAEKEIKTFDNVVSVERVKKEDALKEEKVKSKLSSDKYRTFSCIRCFCKWSATTRIAFLSSSYFLPESFSITFIIGSQISVL